MKRQKILLLIPALLAAGMAHTRADDDPRVKNVVIDGLGETNRAKSVKFEVPTNENGDKYRINITKTVTNYTMDQIAVVQESDSDTGAWRCVESTKDAMKWKIIALKQTPLAYVIAGGLTEILSPNGGGGSGAAPKPDQKPFKVAIPAETVITWENSDGSHDNANAKHRLKIAVGERVTFSVKNSHLGNPSWTATGGSFVSYGSFLWARSLNYEAKVEWAAPPTPGSHTVTVKFPKIGVIGGNMINQGSGTVIMTFDVIKATGTKATRTATRLDSGFISTAAGKWLSAEMKIKYTLEPRDVNHRWSQLHEVGAHKDSQGNPIQPTPEEAKPKDKTGYFVKKPDYLHFPAEGWEPCTVTGDMIDTAGSYNIAPLLLPIAGVSKYGWEKGSFYWDIPLKQRGFDPAAVLPNYDGVEIAKHKQTFEIACNPDPAEIGTGPISVTLTITKTAVMSSSVSISNTVNVN